MSAFGSQKKPPVKGASALRRVRRRGGLILLENPKLKARGHLSLEAVPLPLVPALATDPGTTGGSRNVPAEVGFQYLLRCFGVHTL